MENFVSYLLSLGSFSLVASKEKLSTRRSITGLCADPNLQECVSAAAEENGWDFADRVTGTLFCNSKGISDLSGIEHLVNLERLILVNNNVRDLTPLSALTNLEVLTLGENEIDDITPLSNLVNLTALVLSGNDIRDVQPLSSLNNLSILWLNFNKVEDVRSLGELSELNQLHLRGNRIGGLNTGHVDDLGSLKAAEVIDLRENPKMSYAELLLLKHHLGSQVVYPSHALKGSHCSCP